MARTFATTLVLVAVAVVAGCGGAAGIDSARYERDADAICKDAQRKAQAGGQKLSMYELGRQFKASHRALLDGARRLRALGDDLDGEPPSRVAAFQRRVMPVVAMTRTLADDAELGDRAAVRKHAEQLRRRGASLYRAARSAGLEQCGRGGNRAADRALFVAYRVDLLEKRDEAALQTSLSTNQSSDTPSAFVRVLDDYLQGIRGFNETLVQLTPPRELRRAHRAFKRSLAQLLRLGSDLHAGFLGLPSGRAEVLATLRATAAAEIRAARAEARLRRLLTPKRARGTA